jgi:hypothetical protein
MRLLLGARSILSLSKDAQKGFFDKLRMPFCAGTFWNAQFPVCPKVQTHPLANAS